MKSLIFKDINGTVNVEYVTDLINSSANNFTVMSIKGLTDLDKSQVGLNFSQLPYNIPSFVAFAQTNFLSLDLVDNQKISGGSTNLVALPNISGGLHGGALGEDGI